MPGMNRKAMYAEVEEMLEYYCTDCFLHAQLKKDGGKRSAHKFCINECTVGGKLKFIGKMLTEGKEM